MADANQLYRQGVRAISEDKDYARGRELLVDALRLDPNMDMAWVWLAQVTSDPEKKRRCVEKALKINPNNSQALDLLDKYTTFEPTFPARGAALSNTKPQQNDSAQPITRAKGGSELGRLLISARVNWFRQIQKIVFIAVLAWVFLYPLRLSMFNSPMAERNRIPGTLVGGFIIVCVVCFLYSLVVAVLQNLRIYENGIEHSGLWGKTKLHWEDMTDIKVTNQRYNYRAFYVIPVYSLHIFEVLLTAKGKGKIRINRDYADALPLGEIVLRASEPIVSQKKRGY